MDRTLYMLVGFERYYTISWTGGFTCKLVHVTCGEPPAIALGRLHNMGKIGIARVVIHSYNDRAALMVSSPSRTPWDEVGRHFITAASTKVLRSSW